MLNADILEFIESFEVARLATVDVENRPNVVPICFVCGEKGVIYSAIDSKPKKVTGRDLKRVTNISANPSVSVVFDKYSEDWDQLGYVVVHGLAQLLLSGDERQYAENLLRAKYPQYETYLKKGAPIIRVIADRHVSWGNILIHQSENKSIDK